MFKYSYMILLLASFSCQAMLPKGCIIEPVNTDEVIFTPHSKQIIYVQNLLDETLYLANSEGALTSKLSPKKWSVLWVKEASELKFSCIESKPGAEQRVACRGILKVCLINKVEISESYKQSHWLVENGDIDSNNEALIEKHIKVA